MSKSKELKKFGQKERRGGEIIRRLDVGDVSEASNNARGSIECRLTVQLAPHLVRGIETTSN